MVRELTLVTDLPAVCDGRGSGETSCLMGCYRFTLDLLLQGGEGGIWVGIGAIAFSPHSYDQKDNAEPKATTLMV